jgi:hypothetical protein
MASDTTVNGTQAIKTLNNLNMEGKFKEDSLRQFSNLNTAVITYTSTLGGATAGSTVKLYDAISETEVIFTLRSTNPSAANNEFTYGIGTGETKADNTATNLQTIINSHNAFTATINTTTNTITVTQNTSKSYNSNSTTGFTSAILSVTDFNVNSGNEAAIPSETIGTYQILNKVITDLSSLKKSIITRNKTLQKDVSNDHDSAVTLTSNLSSTHQSKTSINSGLDKNRGNLDETTNSSSPTNQKPSVFESNTIKYSEDALFTLLKGLGYEIIKFNNNVNGSNNGATSGYAGIVAIPISIQAHNNTIQTATLSNVTATIHNINRSDATINTSATTSAGSIPEGTNNSADGVGLIQLINAIINNITLIKRSIKTRELAILTALKLDINNLETSSISNMNVADIDSKITTLKTRGGLLDDNVDNNDLHKPSIFSTQTYNYSEDAVFSLFSCISYELMKLLKGHNGNNNGGGAALAGLQAIPASIEII